MCRRGHQRILAGVELDESDLCISIHEGLVMDRAEAFHCAHIADARGSPIPEAQVRNFSVGFFFGLR